MSIADVTENAILAVIARGSGTAAGAGAAHGATAFGFPLSERFAAIDPEYRRAAVDAERRSAAAA